MTRSLKSVVAATAVIAALAIGPVVLAQSESQPQPAPSAKQGAKGDMMGGGMMGMMNMMQQMSGMMDACTKMMQSMAPAPEAPKDKAPEKKNG